MTGIRWVQFCLWLALCTCSLSIPLPPKVTESPTASIQGSSTPAHPTTGSDSSLGQGTTTPLPTNNSSENATSPLFSGVPPRDFLKSTIWATLKRLSRSTTAQAHLYVDLSSTCTNETGDQSSSTSGSSSGTSSGTSSGASTVDSINCPWTVTQEHQADRIPQYIPKVQLQHLDGKCIGAGMTDYACHPINRELMIFLKKDCFDGHYRYEKKSKTVVVGYYCKE